MSIQSHTCPYKSLQNFHLPKTPTERLGFLSATCLGNTLALQIGDDDALSRLAKRTGECFEEVVQKQFLKYTKRPFSGKLFSEAVTFFLSSFSDSEGDTPLIRITKTISSLGSNEGAQIALIKKIVKIAFRQHLFDPLEYVCHDFQHSLKVAEYAQTICDENTYIKEYFDKYKPLLDDKKIQALTALLCYLHDCGYPHLCERAKANHAIYSADLTDKIRDLLAEILNSNPSSIPEETSLSLFEKFYKDFRLAIFAHNADEEKHTYLSKYNTKSGAFLFNHATTSHNPQKRKLNTDTVKNIFDNGEPGLYAKRIEEHHQPEQGVFKGRKLDLLLPNDELLGSEKVGAVLKENPFHIIRIADNLDFSRTRVSSFQKSPSFITLCALRHQIGLLEKKISQEKDQSKIREAIAEIHSLQTQGKHIIDKQENADLLHVEKNINGISFRHFGGCLSIIILEKIIIKSSGEVSVKVIVDKKMWETLNSSELAFKEEEDILKVASYQMYRMWAAMKQVSLDGSQNLSDGLRFNIEAISESSDPEQPDTTVPLIVYFPTNNVLT